MISFDLSTTISKSVPNHALNNIFAKNITYSAVAYSPACGFGRFKVPGLASNILRTNRL